MGQDVFQSLWIGNRLSAMEVLSIESFLHFGYDYHLYCYEAIANVPRGAKVCDAREILPASEIFYYRGDFANGSPACFSDMWRYKLLLERGHWWVDTDVVCVHPFDFASDHVIGHQRENEGHSINNAVIRTPVGSPLARYCYEACRRIDHKQMQWGATGPKLVQAAIHELDMADAVQPPETFYEIDYWGIERFFDDRELPAETCGVHLWQAMWKDRGIDVDGPFPHDCLYERMRCQFLPGYAPPTISEKQSQRLAAKFAYKNSPTGIKRRNRRNRFLQTIFPWRKAA